MVIRLYALSNRNSAILWVLVIHLVLAVCAGVLLVRAPIIARADGCLTRFASERLGYRRTKGYQGKHSQRCVVYLTVQIISAYSVELSWGTSVFIEYFRPLFAPQSERLALLPWNVFPRLIPSAVKTSDCCYMGLQTALRPRGASLDCFHVLEIQANPKTGSDWHIDRGWYVLKRDLTIRSCD